jgi:hypothetical protein
MPLPVGGPLFTLRVWGLFCPCLEKDEDKSARQSLVQLNRLGARVDWHTNPPSSTRQSINATASGLVTSLFGRGRSFDNNKSNQKPSQHDNIKPPTPVQLQVVDATKDSINWGEPYPELQLVPLPQQQLPLSDTDATAAAPTEATMTTVTTSSSRSNASLALAGGLFKHNSAMSYQLDIPLHHILKVESIDPNMLVIVTKDVHNTSNDNKNNTNNNPPKEKESARISFSSSDDRDAVSLDIMVLVEWNKHRQPVIEEDMPAVTGIRQRAQKAAHFAKREIELREKKRDREKRKAAHMQGTTGLKYTAMAMANQQQ